MVCYRAKRNAEASRKQRVEAEMRAMEEQAQQKAAEAARKRKEEEERLRQVQNEARELGRRPRSGVDEEIPIAAAKAKAEEEQRQRCGASFGCSCCPILTVHARIGKRRRSGGGKSAKRKNERRRSSRKRKCSRHLHSSTVRRRYVI